MPTPKRKNPVVVPEPSPTILSGDVEQLARWVHEAGREVRDHLHWPMLKDELKNVYRHVARKLLTDPPPVIRNLRWTQ